MTPTSQNLLVPLNKLNVSTLNVRKTGGLKIDELAALIESQGLLHPLIVVPATGKRGAYDVAAGGRRLKALQLLAAEQKLAKDAPIECKVVQDDAATAASLAENIAREAMHPADQYLAFQTLVLEGHSVAEVAAAFGVSPLTVSRRLKLAQVSSVLFELYRNDQMSLEQLMAFTLSDDHPKQEQVWKAAPQWQRSPHHLQALLTEGEWSSAHPLVKFVTVAAYKKAGGVIRKDLFSPKEGGYVTDTALLQQLAIAKLEPMAEPYRAAGWKWVEARAQCDHSDLAVYRRAQQGRREPSASEHAEIDAQTNTIATTDQQIEALEDGEGDENALEDLYQSHGKAEAALERLMETLVTWTPEQLALCGVIVTVDNEGGAHAYEGLIRAEDYKAMPSLTADGGAVAGDTPAVKPEHSEKLTRALLAQRNAALQALMLQKPDVAMASLVHSLLLRCCDRYQTCFLPDPLTIRAINTNYAQRAAAPGIEHSPAGVAMAQAWAAWAQRLPQDGKDLFAWLLTLPQADLHSLLTLCVAASIDTMATRDMKGVRAEPLAAVLGLDMAHWWQPTAEGYLSQISKAQIVAAVSEAQSPEAAKLLPAKTKGELVAAAEIALRDTRWLPQVLQPVAD
jgi:ParB family transcriptional regulator, chromosome partitioning protein